MKKRSVLLLTMAVGLTLTACGAPKETPSSTPGSTGGTVQEESRATTKPQETEKPKEAELPAAQEYASSDGAYKVTLLENLSQTDLPLQAGCTMMGLDGGSDRSGFSAIFVGSSKTNVPGNPGDLNSLEDYADYMVSMILDGSGVTVSWEDTDAPSVEGAVQCLAREGVAKSGITSGQAYGCYVEFEDIYYCVVIVGNDDDVEDARKVLAVEVLDGAGGGEETATGTIGFINSLTAVLDSVNGANLRETYKMMVDMGADESQLEIIASQAQNSLSSSWDIEDNAGLMETADWLMKEGHNKDALDFLKELGVNSDMDRDAFAAMLEEENLDEETSICLMAAYDAWSAYGDGAIAAWDLSRVGTIMGFGYAAGYCTYEEAMDKMMEAAKKAQELYDSWEDFNKSYLYGYSYWAEESLEDSGTSAGERAELVRSMESQADGPFSLDWNMELTKEW